jgi:hypothetical protein
MKKLLSVVYPLCALAAFGWLAYLAYPIFPYINDSALLLPAGLFLLFLLLALKDGRDRKTTTDA